MNPLVALDNVETRNVTDDLVDFLLLASTGVAREKRSSDDHGVIIERPRCLVLSTGIEPLAGNLQEMATRTFVIPFSEAYQIGSLSEAKTTSKLANARGDIMAMVFARLARVLRFVADNDALDRVLQAISNGVGPHGKRRCNEWLALMYLFELCRNSDATVLDGLDEISASYAKLVEVINRISAESTAATSMIGVALQALFTTAQMRGGSTVGVPMDGTNSAIEWVTTRELFVALRAVAKDRSVVFDHTNPVQFGRRLRMELEDLRAEGFDVSFRKGAGNVRFVAVRYKRPDVLQAVDEDPIDAGLGSFDPPEDPAPDGPEDGLEGESDDPDVFDLSDLR